MCVDTTDINSAEWNINRKLGVESEPSGAPVAQLVDWIGPKAEHSDSRFFPHSPRDSRPISNDEHK